MRVASDALPAVLGSNPPDDAAAVYRRRRDAHAAAERQLSLQNQLLPHLRAAVFVVAVTLFLIGWFSAGATNWYLGGAGAVVALLALASYHEFAERGWKRQRLSREFHEQSLARLARQWHEIPETPVDVPDSHLATANDLDLFGHASLFHFLCAAKTPQGIDTLCRWLLEPASPAEIRSRQEAVAGLAPELILRETLAVEGALLADRGQATRRFIAWAESDGWLHRRRWLLWTCRALTATMLACTGLILLNLVSPNAAGNVILAVLGVNFLITVVFVGSVHDVFNKISARSGEATRYVTLFQLMYAMPDSTSKLDVLRQEATGQGGGVLRRMRQLSRISAFAGMSRSPLLFLFYLPLQFIFLYDFHILDRYEAWARQYGRYVRRWFQALAEFEALSSLAMLKHDHPDWAFPQVTTAADRLQATSLGHPLLPDDTRVVNHVDVGPPGSFLLVTGSNMSGKSTLLRAIGVNVVLAQAGGPVCASGLEMPPVSLATNMRVRDSLEQGVSFYMAELMRLKEIVDLARQSAVRKDGAMLYLLDEILLGTNSRERHIAVVRVMHHLLESGAIGAISTHDLELATCEPLASACHAVHFRETLHDSDAPQPMTFDYKLREGVATTSNALKLLEIVGLGGE